MEIASIICPASIEEKLETKHHVTVFFIYKPATATAIMISARDMSAQERRAYGRK